MMTPLLCPYCLGERVVGVDVAPPDSPHRELVDMPCRCTMPPPPPPPKEKRP